MNANPTTKPLTWYGTDVEVWSEDWIFQFCASWEGTDPLPMLVMVIFAIGADADVPFSFLPRIHALQRDKTGRFGGQLFLAWFGFVVGFRCDGLVEN